MTDNQRILQLLENLMDSGASPEEVCSEYPQLLPDLRAQWNQCQRIDAQIDELFGSSQVSDGNSSDLSDSETDLPHVPGYYALAVLGRGGMGIVYRARHIELNRNIALKMLLSGAYAGRVERARFLREARTAASLRHANIVQVYDAGEFDGRPFFTMELVEGETLAQFLGGNPQPAAKALAMLLTLAEATAYAHQSGIIHRDLKPSNVLLTTDGTLKISDFGLARRLDGEAGVTISGTRVGTPSYMAPEQSLGSESVGPPADVYSLGAILYEMLTGRPPFHGESAAETERQLQTQEPVPPSKLNARVPRDLETICLMCLRKDPQRRFASAAELAEDLRRFQRNEPISARQTGALERAAKWVGRHPAVATASASGLLMAAVAIVAIIWFVSQRSTNNRLIEEQLRDAIRFQQQSMWKEADAAIERASARLGEHGPTGLHRQLEQARRDSELAAHLDTICLDQAGCVDGFMDFRLTYQKYQNAFRDSALGEVTDPPDQVALRIRNSSIRNALVAAVYDWMLCADPQTRQWLWEIARRVDHDPTGWRDRVCEPVIWNNGEALSKMAGEAVVTDHSAPFLMAVGRQLKALNRDTIPFLKKVQDAYPQDFWINLTLADALWVKGDVVESIRFYQAAIAARPNAAVSYNNLGMAFDYEHRYEDAIASFRHAMRIDPQAQLFRNSLAAELFFGGHFAEAIPALRQCLGKNDHEATYRGMLGQSLENVGRVNEAIVQYRSWIETHPRDTPFQKCLCNALIKLGRDDEAVTAWQTAIAANPREHDAWDGLAEYYLHLGRTADYRNTCRQLLQQFSSSPDPAVRERIAKTCFLLPATEDQTRKATALIDYAVNQDRIKPTWVGPYFQFTKGLAEYRGGHYASAISILSTKAANIFGPAPRIISAMCQWRLGETDQAHQTLALAIRSYDWTTAPFTQEAWMYQTLRQEAEAMMQTVPPTASK